MKDNQKTQLIIVLLIGTLFIISLILFYSLDVLDNKETKSLSQFVPIKLPAGTNGEGIWFEPDGIKVFRGNE